MNANPSPRVKASVTPPPSADTAESEGSNPADAIVAVTIVVARARPVMFAEFRMRLRKAVVTP
jgi:hypothetical protein